MTGIVIDYLRNHPQHAQACAAWSFAEWGCQTQGRTLADTQAHYIKLAGLDENTLPTVYLALAGDRPAGMVTLSAEALDADYRPDLSPWLAALYVHPFYRGRGVAAMLMRRLEDDARKRHGFTALHLVTDVAAGLYEKHGWTPLDSAPSTFCIPGMTSTIMQKPLAY